MAQIADALSMFNEALDVHFEPCCEVREEAERYLSFLGGSARLERSPVESSLFIDINAKFRLNADGIRHFLAFAASQRITFNFHEKRAIGHAFDAGDELELRRVLERRLPDRRVGELLSEARWITRDETVRNLHRELNSPTLTRKDSKPRDWAPNILEGLFTGLLSTAFGLEALHRFNDPAARCGRYEPDFWRYLQQRYPEFYSDRPRLVILTGVGDEDRASLLSKVRTAYRVLPEFGYLAILLRGSGGREWQLAGDVVLYAEKHIRRALSNSFFRTDQITEATAAGVPDVDLSTARFDIWNDGFYFQDCIFMEGHHHNLLLLLQKREANETPLPCPSCRSLRVRGNSYPSLGVKSWECANVLCPGKSKFGRGKRYSFVQLLRQAAIEEPGNEIPRDSVRAWLRDVQPCRSFDTILDMLVRHYSLAGDSVLVDSEENCEQALFGRTVRRELLDIDAMSASTIPPSEFFSSEWFARYNVVNARPALTPAPHVVTVDALTAFHGDARVALRILSSNWIDGAVTSPPYYNAREYSQWQNIYCYLNEMLRVNREVFRVLKPGGYYLYNIFDYFDNENTVALSAMGEKRLTLSAYMMDLFRRIGFECVGNIVWDKGDIEGKRGFNGGNFSPYYQAPFNCWEHVLVLRKPPMSSPSLQFPAVVRQSAVIKMIAGKNVHGHTAPFPECIPALLTSRLPRGAKVLDPFAGSMTTAVAAARSGCKAICIEKDTKYFALGIRRFRESQQELNLL